MQSKGGAPENGSLVQTIPKVGNPIISQVPRNRPGPTPLQAVILVVNLPDVTKGCDIKPIEAIEMSLSCCSEDWNLCYHHLQAMRLEQPI